MDRHPAQVARGGFTPCCGAPTAATTSAARLELRLHQHQEGLGALHTKHRRPVVLVWHEGFDRIDEAFAREKKVQNWSRAKREALIRREDDAVPALAEPTRRRRRREAAGDAAV